MFNRVYFNRIYFNRGIAALVKILKGILSIKSTDTDLILSENYSEFSISQNGSELSIEN